VFLQAAFLTGQKLLLSAVLKTPTTYALRKNKAVGHSMTFPLALSVHTARSLSKASLAVIKDPRN
jgi:hypothetical protein